MKRAAITIDVDSLRVYREIHGLPAVSTDEEDPIYTLAVPRFFELLSGAPATLFLIGADAPRYADRFRAGSVEIASHSFAHDYRLTQRSPAELRGDLSRAHAALSSLTPGRPIMGFRAPGYNTSPDLLAAVAELGYSYDSSRLPSPLYFGLRAAAIGAYALLRRPSRSLVGSFSAFAGSLAPYYEGPLLELPMACEPLTRWPLIGTTYVVLPRRARLPLALSAVRRLPYVNFEMHAIDLLDRSEVPPDLAAAQRDLAVPVAEKMRAFRELFRMFADECSLMTLRDIADTERVGSPPARQADLLRR